MLQCGCNRREDRGELQPHNREAILVSGQDYRLDGAGVPLAATLFIPQGDGPHPGLVICHGMPAGPRPEPGAPPPLDDGLSYLGVAEWCALEGFATLIFNFRGTGESGGNFHPMGWAHDLDAVISWMLARPEVDAGRLVLLGSSMGAAVATYSAAHRPEVAGLVSFAGPAETRTRQRPAEDVERMREMGIIRDPGFPPSLEDWANEGLELSPSRWVSMIAPRPLLILHGDADDVVSPESAHVLYERAGEGKELRMLPGVGHRFRSEPTAMAAAIEWLRGRFGADAR